MSVDLIKVKAITNLSPKVKTGDIGWAALKDFNEKVYFDVQFHGSTLKDVVYTLLERVDEGKETQKPKKVYFILKNFPNHEKFKNGVPYKGKLNDDGSLMCDGFWHERIDNHFIELITKEQYKALKLARIRAEIEGEVRVEFKEEIDQLKKENKNLFLCTGRQAQTICRLNEKIAQKDEAYKKLLTALNEAQETIKLKQLVIDEFNDSGFRFIGQCKESQFSEVDGLKLKLDRWWVDAEKLCGSDIYIKIK